jgi:hypothetical protein
VGEFASEGASLAKDVAGELFEGVKFVAEETLKTFQGNRQLIAVEAGPVSAVDKTLQEQYQFHWNPAANYTFTGLYYTHIRATTSGIKEEHAALGKGDADDSVDDPARPTLSGKDLETKMLDHLRAYYTKKYADRWAAKSKTDDTTGLPENHESILNKLELDLAARYESKWTRAY